MSDTQITTDEQTTTDEHDAKIENLKTMYKTELDLIEKHISNDYIYNIILKHETVIDDVKYKLRSNINVYEMCFLGILCQKINAKNVLEIGCANGTSGMVLINSIIKNNGGKLTSLDPFQTTQWNNVGKYNVNKIIELNNSDCVVIHEIIEDYSTKILDTYVKSNKYFDLIFVDGSHSYVDVVIDIYCSIKILKRGGLLIIDDVLHTGVKLVINDLIYISNIEKVHLSENDHNIVKSNYRYYSLDKSYTNCRTMYAYKKI